MALPNKRLEAARLQRRWSVDVASQHAGVSVNTFNRWERGLQTPQLETLDQLCKAFGMSPEELGFAHAITAKRRSRARSSEGTLTRPPALSEALTSLLLPMAGPPLAMAEPAPSTSPTPGVSFTTILNLAAHDQEARASLKQAQKNLEDMDPQRQNTIDTEEGVSRRKAIALLISTPSALFGMAQANGSHSTVLHPQETLSLSAVSIPLCWQLYFEGGFNELEQLLPGYLAQLSALDLQNSLHQKKTARLAAQAQQLACLLALQRQDFGTALKHARDALKYGQTAEDADLQLAATVRCAYIYFCLKQHEQCFRVYSQQALAYQEDCSPLLRGFLYASLAETYAGRGEKGPALEYLRQAYDIFPQRPEDDPNFSYTHFRRLTLDNLEGQVYLHLKQPRQAWEAFLRVDRATPPIPYKLAVTIHKAETMLALNEMEQACSLLECAAMTALALGSSLRYGEAYTVYRQIQDTWRHERPVKALQELFYQNLFR